MKEKISNSELKAYKSAIKDIKKDNPFRSNEGKLDNFYDEVKSTKDSVFYEEGDGDLEISYKKMVRKINRDSFNIK